MRLKLSYRSFLTLRLLIWLCYSALALFWLFTLTKTELFISVLLTGVIVQLTLQSFLKNWYTLGRPKLLDWFRLTTFIVLIVNFFNLLDYLDSHDNFLVDQHVYVPVSTVVPTVGMILAGLLALSAGEALAQKFVKPVAEKKVQTYRLRNTVLFASITILTTFVQLYLMISGLLGYGTDIENRSQNIGFLLQTVQIIAPFLMVLLASLVFIFRYRNRLFRFLLIYYFGFQLIYGFLSGMKEEIIIPIILLLIPYILSGGKIPKYLLGVAVMFIIILYPINNTYRDITDKSRGRIPKSQAFAAALTLTLQKDFGELFTSGSEQYGSRLSLFPMNMYSVHINDQWQYFKYLDRYPYLPVAWFVPRAILPDKPESNTGALLYKMQTGSDSTSVTPSTYGWAYLEGGFIPLILTFLLFGLSISILEIRLRLTRLFDLIIFCLVLITLIKIETDIYFRLSGMLQTLLVSYLMFRALVLTKRTTV